MKPAPRDISEPIFLQTEDFRAWRWSDCPEWEESITRLDSILRQCTSDAERAYVMRVARNSPVKDTPGPDADARDPAHHTDHDAPGTTRGGHRNG